MSSYTWGQDGSVLSLPTISKGMAKSSSVFQGDSRKYQDGMVSLSSHFSSSHYVDAVSSVLIPHGVIQERVKKMARNILEDVLQVNPGGE